MRVAAVIAALMSVGLSACFTGERPRLVEGAATTGDPASDAVLARLDGVGDVVFTADYDLLTRFGDMHTPASVVQAEPGRRSITIGDVRFLLDGAEAATCELGTGACSSTIDAGLTSNTQLGPDFYTSSAAARLRRDTELRAGPTTSSSEMIAGQSATCVTIPLADAPTTYCALDAGPLARLDAADVVVTMTAYDPAADESRFAHQLTLFCRLATAGSGRFQTTARRVTATRASDPTR